MCGRYFLEDPAKSEAVKAWFAAWQKQRPRRSKRPKVGEIFPRDAVLVAGGKKGAPRTARWGLRSGGRELINARAETLLEKPTYAPLFPHGRCLFIASAFYEWGHPDAREQLSLFEMADDTPKLLGRKVKFAFACPDAPILYMAGLLRLPSGRVMHDGLPDENADDALPEAVIVTTAANASMRETHSRMPLVLSAAEAEAWLTDDAGASTLIKGPCRATLTRQAADEKG